MLERNGKTGSSCGFSRRTVWQTKQEHQKPHLSCISCCKYIRGVSRLTHICVFGFALHLLCVPKPKRIWRISYGNCTLWWRVPLTLSAAGFSSFPWFSLSMLSALSVVLVGDSMCVPLTWHCGSSDDTENCFF